MQFIGNPFVFDVWNLSSMVTFIIRWTKSVSSLTVSSIGHLSNPPCVPPPPVNLACVECELAVGVLQGELNAGVSYEAMVQEAILVCSAQSSLTETYCQGYIPLVAVRIHKQCLSSLFILIFHLL